MTERYPATDYAKLSRKQSHTAAKPVRTEDGYFGSTGEYNRWRELKLLQMAGVITELTCHKRIPIHVNGVWIKTYRSDFTYSEDGVFTVEDFKGRKSREWKITKKLLKAVFPQWRILETC